MTADPLFTWAESRDAGMALVERNAGEQWKSVPGYEGLYSVSTCGRIRRDRVNLISNPSIANGYRHIVLWKDGAAKGSGVHRLVMLAFRPVPNFEELQVNHIDGQKTNNNIANLEWVTPSQNIRHSIYVLGNKMLPPTPFGGANPYSRPVFRLHRNGEVAERYESIADAVTKGYRACCIVEVCGGTQRSHRGFLWKYATGPLRKGHQITNPSPQ